MNFFNKMSFFIFLSSSSYIKCSNNNVSFVHPLFYTVAKKFVLPGVNFTCRFKYVDLFAGCSFGYQIYIYSNNNFKLGLLGMRVGLLQAIFDFILCKKNAPVTYYLFFSQTTQDVPSGRIFSDSLGYNIFVNIMALKFNFLNIKLFEIPIIFIVNIALSNVLGVSGNVDRQKKSIIFSLVNIFIPSISIDLTQLIQTKFGSLFSNAEPA